MSANAQEKKPRVVCECERDIVDTVTQFAIAMIIIKALGRRRVEIRFACSNCEVREPKGSISLIKAYEWKTASVSARIPFTWPVAEIGAMVVG